MSDTEGAKNLPANKSTDGAEPRMSLAQVIARMRQASDALATDIEKPAAKDAPAPVRAARDEKFEAVVAPASKPAPRVVTGEAAKSPTTAKVEAPTSAAPKIELADLIAAEEKKIAMLAGKAAAIRAQQAKPKSGFDVQTWGRAAAGAAVVIALSGAAYMGLRDGAGRRSAPAVASAEHAQPAKPTPEQMLAAETADLRRQTHALTQEVQTLRASLQKQAEDTRAAQAHASAATATIAQTTMRLDRIERDATSKFEKQATRVDRLERLSADPVVTGAVEKSAAAHTAPKKPEASNANEQATAPASDYVLRSVRNGVAVVQTRRGMIEVSAGDMIPGVGRVRSIEKVDGRWIVVTRDGVIDAD